jgi:hypothetical protein
MAGKSTDVLLSCAAVSDALTSLSRLLEIRDKVLISNLATCRINWHSDIAPEDQVVRHIGYAESELPSPAAIRWFHATRAPMNTSFEEGLLPTLGALEKLWDSLRAVALSHGWASSQEWAAYRASFEQADRQFSRQFHSKRVVSGWDGPFAFLVRDAAVGDHRIHKDFTAISEAAEDICADFEAVLHHPLRAGYQAATARCLVVFIRPGDWPGAVCSALNYVHRGVVRLDQGRTSNTNFSGNGRAVPPSWIERVEWL